MKRATLILVALALLLGGVGQAGAGNFTTINVPGAAENYLNGSNNSGQIVGTYIAITW